MGLERRGELPQPSVRDLPSIGLPPLIRLAVFLPLVVVALDAYYLFRCLRTGRVAARPMPFIWLRWGLALGTVGLILAWGFNLLR